MQHAAFSWANVLNNVIVRQIRKMMNLWSYGRRHLIVCLFLEYKMWTVHQRTVEHWIEFINFFVCLVLFIIKKRCCSQRWDICELPGIVVVNFQFTPPVRIIQVWFLRNTHGRASVGWVFHRYQMFMLNRIEHNVTWLWKEFGRLKFHASRKMNSFRFVAWDLFVTIICFSFKGEGLHFLGKVRQNRMTSIDKSIFSYPVKTIKKNQ